MSYLAASDVEEAGHASYWAPLLTIPVAMCVPLNSLSECLLVANPHRLPCLPA